MKIQEIYRPYRSGTVAAPMLIRSAGHYRVLRNWRDPEMTKPFLELYWCIAGTGEFRHGETVWQLNKEEVFFYLPGDCHRITALTDGFEYFWFTVDGVETESVIRGFGIERGALAAGRCPEELFLRLMDEVRGIGRDSEFRAGSIAYAILTQALIGPRGGSGDFLLRFRKVVEEQYDKPEFSIEEMSFLLGVHRSTLARLVVKECGISPQEYLTGYRIQIALEMMRQEWGASIKEVAEATGFANQNYFAKVFAKRLGKSPSEFRKQL